MLFYEVLALFLTYMVGAVQYNPQHAWGEMCEDISRELKKWQLITLTVTKRRAYWEHPGAKQQLPYHWAIRCRWRRSCRVNNSCGISSLISHQLPRNCLNHVHHPPLGLRGRAAALRRKLGKK
eukprot:6896671-Pyramimonas_sp.AAC.1